MATLYGNLALAYQSKKDYQTASQYYQKQSELITQIFG
jgi:hypothetical protein